MDAGKNPDSLINAEDTRLHEYMLPHLTEAERHKYRPDILCLTVPPKLDRQQVREELLWEQCSIYILEVSFCRDTRYTEHFEQKSTQHSQLVQELIKAGWNKQNIHLIDPILFGIGGSLYHQSKQTLQDALHIPPYRINPAFQHIQKAAAARASQIVGTRRSLESSQGIHIRPRKGGGPT
jgi:hypothetical protein